jgi:hypothetical protein
MAAQKPIARFNGLTVPALAMRFQMAQAAEKDAEAPSGVFTAAANQR